MLDMETSLFYENPITFDYAVDCHAISTYTKSRGLFSQFTFEDTGTVPEMPDVCGAVPTDYAAQPSGDVPTRSLLDISDMLRNGDFPYSDEIDLYMTKAAGAPAVLSGDPPPFSDDLLPDSEELALWFFENADHMVLTMPIQQGASTPSSHAQTYPFFPDLPFDFGGDLLLPASGNTPSPLPLTTAPALPSLCHVPVPARLERAVAEATKKPNLPAQNRRKRAPKVPVPEEKKTARYLERRIKNTEAARRNREIKRSMHKVTYDPLPALDERKAILTDQCTLLMAEVRALEEQVTRRLRLMAE